MNKLFIIGAIGAYALFLMSKRTSGVTQDASASSEIPEDVPSGNAIQNDTQYQASDFLEGRIRDAASVLGRNNANLFGNNHSEPGNTGHRSESSNYGILFPYHTM